ncbi:MAG: hypothetical protein HY289_00465 [Planctomycetes bacterium]|nr:hypothetical protein [Planctomycetota bacterium]
MEIDVRFRDLPTIQPQLAWGHPSAAAVAIFGDCGAEDRFKFDIAVLDVPGFSDDAIRLNIDRTSVSEARVARVRRTYDRNRLVEMAAIAIAGLALYHAGGHIIYDVALRGTGVDYLVDEGDYLLEIAGRSSRREFQAAWNQKWQQLLRTIGGDFFVFVAEFETCTGRLAFKD